MGETSQSTAIWVLTRRNVDGQNFCHIVPVEVELSVIVKIHEDRLEETNVHMFTGSHIT